MPDDFRVIAGIDPNLTPDLHCIQSSSPLFALNQCDDSLDIALLSACLTGTALALITQSHCFGSVKITGIEEINAPVERLEVLGTKNYTAPENLPGMKGSDHSDIYSLGVLVYNLQTGQLPYSEKMSHNFNLRTLNKIEYQSSIIHNPMIPLWMGGTIHKAVKNEPRSRCHTHSEFFFDLTHPSPAFMRHSVPLLENNPVVFWQYVSASLLAANLGWLLYFFS